MHRTAKPSTEPSIETLRWMTKRDLHALLAGDPAEAAPWVALAARHGLAEAQLLWGRMLLEGTGVERNQAEALGWFMTAARSGDGAAMNMVGRCREHGWGTARDTTIAADWYRRSADAGHDWGEYNYANALFDGIGVPIDPPGAIAWYRKAAAQGHGRAMNQLGRCCEEGWGTARDHAAAADWYSRSAEAGYFRGQYNHAMILVGKGRANEAADWFLKAAKGGPLEMRRRIGRELLARAEPVLHPVGLKALALCCESGGATDLYHYGRVLLRGFRCLADPETGRKWLACAAAQGHAGAAAELQKMAA
jgi:hypothetical protein